MRGHNACERADRYERTTNGRVRKGLGAGRVIRLVSLNIQLGRAGRQAGGGTLGAEEGERGHGGAPGDKYVKGNTHLILSRLRHLYGRGGE